MSTKINPILLDPAGAADGAALVYNSASGVAWGVPVSAGGGTEAYANVASLPLANNTTGSLAYVEATNRLYIWTGVGWFNIALINTNPSITSGPSASYDLAIDGTPTVLTLVASDPEGLPITWSSQVTTGTLGNTAVITQNNNVFTITPSTNTAHAGTFGVTFTASDGVNLATAASSFTLLFGYDWLQASQQARVVSSDLQTSDNFGNTIAVSVNTMIVGARGEDTGGSDAGAAYIFTRSGTTWTQQAKIQSTGIAASDEFGTSVSIDGDTAIIGAPKQDTGGSDAGAAYIFVRSGTTWTQQAKIQSTDIAASDQFGTSVSIDGDIAIIGASGDASGAGAAYIFTRSGTTWTQQAKLVPAAANTGSVGGSVSINGNSVVIGAINSRVGGVDSGAAYIFVRSGTTWTEQSTLLASDAQFLDYFGASVAIDGNDVVVGAWGEDTTGSDAGAAYIFTRSGTTWTQQAKLVSPTPSAADIFGGAVAIQRGVVVIGNHAIGPTDLGVAFIFTRSGTTWTRVKTIQATVREDFDYFGASVAIDGGTIVVGSPFDRLSGSFAGSAYAFTAPSA